jgi:hypothetical protein
MSRIGTPIAAVAVGTTPAGEIWQISIFVEYDPAPVPGLPRRRQKVMYHGTFVEHDTASAEQMRGIAHHVYQDLYNPRYSKVPAAAAEWARDLLCGVTVVELSRYGSVAHLVRLLHAQGLCDGRAGLPWAEPAVDVATLAAGHVHGSILDGSCALSSEERRIVEAAVTPPYHPVALSHLLGFTPPPDDIRCSADIRVLWTHTLWNAVHRPAVPFDVIVSSGGRAEPSRLKMAGKILEGEMS